MAVIYVNIGSNLGDRKALIEHALTHIGKNFGYYCTSEFVESDPWGFDSTNRFVNIGVAFLSDLHPEKILDILQYIEKEISTKSHRDSAGNYSDREIDIDIMAIDEQTYSSARLTVPHKHLLERDFFLKPLYELAPDWRHPALKESPDTQTYFQKFVN